MRDKTLLADLVFYLTEATATEGWGRYRQYLLRRVQKEIDLNPQELGSLCRTFVHLFNRPDTDCQPSGAWQKLADKVTLALDKHKHVDISTEDPWIGMLTTRYRDRNKQAVEAASPSLYPFDKESKWPTVTQATAVRITDANMEKMRRLAQLSITGKLKKDPAKSAS